MYDIGLFDGLILFIFLDTGSNTGLLLCYVIAQGTIHKLKKRFSCKYSNQ